jgi:hypothetical protein
MEADFAALGQAMKGSNVTVAKYQADIDREFANEKLGLKTFPTIIYLPKVSSQCHLQSLERFAHVMSITAVMLAYACIQSH